MMEPTTADETLSLALIFYNKLSFFFEAHCPHEDERVEREIQKLENALRAIPIGKLFEAIFTVAGVGQFAYLPERLC